MTMLSVQSVSKNFSGFAALSDVTLEIQPGEVRAIIGANGAGKSTLLNIVSGVLQPTTGRIIYDGHHVAARSPSDLVLLGLSRSFQITSIFNEFSVFENVQIAVLAFRRLTCNLFSAAAPLMRAETVGLLDAVGISDMAERPAGELAAGDRKRLEFALTLAAQPKMLLLDEPTAGMAPRERDIVIQLLMSLNQEQGVTILFTEHDLNMVSRLAHRITVLHHGRVLAEGGLEEIKANDLVKTAYIGGQVDAVL